MDLVALEPSEKLKDMLSDWEYAQQAAACREVQGGKGRLEVRMWVDPWGRVRWVFLAEKNP